MNISRTIVALVLGLGLLTPVTPTVAQIPQVTTLKDGVPTLAPLLKRITPAVVNIAVKTRSSASRNPMMQDPFFRFFF